MDRSLDELITTRGGGGNRRGFNRGGGGGGIFKRREGGGGGGGFGVYGHDDRSGNDEERGGGGAFRRNRVSVRPSAPYSRGGGSVDTVWKHDLYTEEEEEEEDGEVEMDDGDRRGGAGAGTKLLISNLAYSVGSDDLKDLFEPLGVVKRVTLQYDKSGRSLGNATVVFARRDDAITAMKKYNDVSLDESPMSISMGGPVETVGRRIGRRPTNLLRSAVREALVVSVDAPRSRGIGTRRPRIPVTATGRTVRMAGLRRRTVPLGRSVGRVTQRRSAGFGSKSKKPTVEELDAEMDAYNNDN